MGVSGCGVLRIRAVTMMLKGSVEEGQREGEEVLSVRPTVTDGLGELEECQHT